MKLSKIIIFTAIFICLSTSAHAEKLKGIVFVSNQTKDIRPNRIIREYVIGETANFAFLAQGFSLEESGAVDLTVDITLTGPKGEVLFEEKDFAKAKSPSGKKVGLFNGRRFPALVFNLPVPSSVRSAIARSSSEP